MDTKFVLRIASDGSIHVIPEDKPTSFFSALVILICFILGFTTNAIISLTIIYEKSLRNTTFNLAVLYLSSASFVDCSLNESLAFTFAVSRNLIPSWCKVSSSIFLLSLILHTMSILCLSAERLLSLTQHHNLLRSKIKQISLPAAGGGSWLLAVVLVIPIVCDISPTRFFRNRNACDIAPVNITYPVVLFLLGFVLPWLGFTILVLQIFWQFYHSPNDHSQVQNCGIPYKEQIYLRISITIILLYCLLIIPHILIVIISQLTAVQNSVYHSEVGIIDSIFSWSKYHYNIIVPIFTLIFHKDLRKQCESLFCVWHNQNSVANIELLSLPIENKQILKQRTVAVNTPVLFITSDGLCLRITSLTNSRRQYSCGLCDLSVNILDMHSTAKQSANGNRKNVRFASTINEILPSESGISSGSQILDTSSRTLNDTFIISR